jgi:hypothetical protein
MRCKACSVFACSAMKEQGVGLGQQVLKQLGKPV